MNHGLYDNPASEGLILLAKINTIKKNNYFSEHFISAS